MRPPHAILIAVSAAALAGALLFRTGTDLGQVASRTIFSNCLIALTLVPFYAVLRFRAGTWPVADVPQRIKEGMRSVVPFALLAGILTYILFKTLGDPLIAERMALVREAIAASEGMGQEERHQRLSFAERIYSPATQVLANTVAVMFTGFISSIIAAVSVRKG